MADEHSVGLRELRHKTSEVLRRVRAWETLEVTDRGTPIARLVPVDEPHRSSRIEQLIAEGRLIPAKRTGFMPTPIAGDGTDRLARALEEDRSERL